MIGAQTTQLLPPAAITPLRLTGKEDYTRLQLQKQRVGEIYTGPIVGGRPTEIAQNKIVVRTLTPEDIADMRREPGQAGFDEQLTSIKGHLRTTLPALIQLSSEKDGSPTERIVALPSLGWSRDAWTSSDMLKDDENAKYFYDIRYLKVDESLTQPLEPGSTM